MGTKASIEAAVPKELTIQRWVLVSRPKGLLSVENFELREEVVDTTALAEGEAIVQCEMLSVDAFLRTMLDAEAYHGAKSLGDTVPALGYGIVVASANKKLTIGSRVTGMLGACSYSKLPQKEADELMPMAAIPGVETRTWLGLLGFTSGLTAWVGMHSVAKAPRKGEVAVVSGASGATGSIAAQLAKINGAAVIGIAGGETKKQYLLKTLGLDGAVDYKDPKKTVGEQLDALCPEGIDYFFDTVGGEILDDVLWRIRKNGRIVICGASSQYNGNLNVGTVRGPSNYLKLSERGAVMVGYNVMNYFSRIPLAIIHLLWLRWRKKIFMTEQIESGVAAFVPAMIKMFTGGHMGKLLVDVAIAPKDENTPLVKPKAA
jgi:hypothetical protein